MLMSTARTGSSCVTPAMEYVGLSCRRFELLLNGLRAMSNRYRFRNPSGATHMCEHMAAVRVGARTQETRLP